MKGNLKIFLPISIAQEHVKTAGVPRGSNSLFSQKLLVCPGGYFVLDYWYAQRVKIF